MGSLLNDLLYAVRTARRSAGYALVVVAILGLGIGANAAFFGVVNAALLRPLDYADPNGLVALHEGFPDSQIDRSPFSPLDIEDLQREQQAFADLGAYRTVTFELTGDSSPTEVPGARTSAGVFRVLGVPPALGRTFSAEEDRVGGDVAVLSWALWQRQYGADPAIVGRSIRLDRRPYQVIGVMPRAFTFPQRGASANNEPADVWIPLTFTPIERLERGSGYNYSVVARLKPGTSIQMAQAHLDSLSRSIAENYPAAVRSAGFTPRLSVRTLREEISAQVRMPLLMLLGAGGFVLLVVCANVANLMLSRAVSRQLEFAVRTSLGAGRGQLLRLLLAEALVLSVGGAVVGILLAYWGVQAAPRVLTRSIPGLTDVTLDWRVVAFTVVVALVTALVFAVLPLVTLDRRSPADALRENTARSAGGRRSLLMQRAFVVSAVALSFVLLVGAGLLLRSFSALSAVDLGFRPEQVVTVSLVLPQSAYPTPATVNTFQRQLLGELTTVPGVRTAAIASDFPLMAGVESRRFQPDASAIAARVTPMTKLTWVRGPYFDTFGLTLLEGRFFTDAEHEENRQVVIVNQKLADRFWSGESAIGKRLKWGTSDSQYPWLTVVGVVSDVVDERIGTEAEVHAYEPYRQLPAVFLRRNIHAAVRTGSAAGLVSDLRAAVGRVDPQLATAAIEPMRQHVDDAYAPRRFGTWLLIAFAAGALLLAWVGLYGLLAYSTTRRRREIAVRLALGAHPQAVARMIVVQGIQLVAIGLAAGLLASSALMPLVSSLLYRTSRYDAVTFITVPLLVLVAALLACIVPAWRAARIAPLAALRAD